MLRGIGPRGSASAAIGPPPPPFRSGRRPRTKAGTERAGVGLRVVLPPTPSLSTFYFPFDPSPPLPSPLSLSEKCSLSHSLSLAPSLSPCDGRTLFPSLPPSLSPSLPPFLPPSLWTVVQESRIESLLSGPCFRKIFQQEERIPQTLSDLRLSGWASLWASLKSPYRGAPLHPRRPDQARRIQQEDPMSALGQAVGSGRK